MSTRSQIIIQTFKNVLPKENTMFHQELIYHHFDGYLMGVGLELLEKLKELSEFDIEETELRGLIYFLNHGYEQEEINNEKEEGINNLHSDIEYLYYIRIQDNKVIELFYKEVSFYDDSKDKKEIEQGLRDKKDLLSYFDKDNRILYRDLEKGYFKINFNN